MHDYDTEPRAEMPEREGAVDTLSHQVEALHAELSMLEGRLKPVLRHTNSDKAIPSVLAEAGQSRLADLIGQVTHARHRVTDLITYLDV